MKFNLKHLILPLSIIGCINTYNINAMEDIPNEVNQTPMSWVDFEAVLISFSNNEELNDMQRDFIKRIAKEITKNSDVNNWIKLTKEGYKGLPRREPKYDMTDNEYQNIIQSKVNATRLSNKDILSYTYQDLWIQCLNSIYPISNSSSNYWDDYRKK